MRPAAALLPPLLAAAALSLLTTAAAAALSARGPATRRNSRRSRRLALAPSPPPSPPPPPSFSLRRAPRRRAAVLAAGVGRADDGDRGTASAPPSPPPPLLDEIEDLTRSFESVQRTIEVSRGLYEERTRSLESKIEELERERGDAGAGNAGSARSADRGGEEELERLARERDELSRRLIDARATALRERDELKAELRERYECELAELRRERDELKGEAEELRLKVSEPGGSPPGPPADWEGERERLIGEKNALSERLIDEEVSHIKAREWLTARFESSLGEREAAVREMRERIESLERERSSLRKLLGLGLRRIGSFFRLRRRKGSDKAKKEEEFKNSW